jgi:hypothetical protein
VRPACQACLGLSRKPRWGFCLRQNIKSISVFCEWPHHGMEPAPSYQHSQPKPVGRRPEQGGLFIEDDGHWNLRQHLSEPPLVDKGGHERSIL